MFGIRRKDPVEKAKKHVEKALKEIEDNYPDYASTEFEKAAKLFLEVSQIDFAVKYYREAAYTALEADDHTRAAQMKICAAEALLLDSTYDEAGGFYSEASDHYFRVQKFRESMRTLSLSIICLLAARNFESGVNMFRKAEKRVATSKKSMVPMYSLAKYAVRILCEGLIYSEVAIQKIIDQVNPKLSEQVLIQFVVTSVKLALQTEVVIEWAGQEADEVSVKSPNEFELRYKCPVPVQVIDCRWSISSSLKFNKEPPVTQGLANEESWLFEVVPVLSGDGKIGPFSLTLAGESVLVHKLSNSLEFRISSAPAELDLELSPTRIACDLGDEAILDIVVMNVGEGPADNILVKMDLSDGLELPMGGDEKTIQFLGSGEKVRFQIFVRGVGLGEESASITIKDGTGKLEVTKTSIIVVE